MMYLINTLCNNDMYFLQQWFPSDLILTVPEYSSWCQLYPPPPSFNTIFQTHTWMYAPNNAFIMFNGYVPVN